MTCAPGAWRPGRHLDADVRLREDLSALVQDHGAGTLVTLLERHELATLGNLSREARRAGVCWLHFPIPDMGVPPRPEAARALVARILRTLDRGENVVVHCWAGLGRTGTIVACCLVARGAPPLRAIALTRAVRPGAVQRPEQEQFVRAFAELGGG
jgi:ADP-ribosyl-[dinitrogen reductase] hydrolase